MNETDSKKARLISDLNKTKEFFLNNLDQLDSPVRIYTHLDADGLSSGAILGKVLYREGIPFEIRVLRQLEREEIEKIIETVKSVSKLLIFCDFGSGQFRELQDQFRRNDSYCPFIVFDHHLPQDISSKTEEKDISNIYEKTRPWHVNPYFYGIDGSIEISGAGMCYFFAKVLNEKNIDLAPIALIGATGDVQNQGHNNSFIGLNSEILGDALDQNLVKIVNDLNFSPIKPLNEAIAFSSDIKLPGLSGSSAKTLKFLKTLGILMRNSEDKIKSLNELNQDEKQKISSAIIEYATLKMNIDPQEIIENLIVNRYILKNEPTGTALYDFNEFSNLLNSCGRSNNGSVGIAIAMGDRRVAYEKAQQYVIDYKKALVEALTWLQDKRKIQQKNNIQYFFGEDVISENIVGTIASMLIFGKIEAVDLKKPIFGCALRENEDVYKISGRASQELVEMGINLSEAIRETLKRLNLEALGGGHPPAAGTKVPQNKIDDFLNTCDIVIKEQLFTSS